MMTALLALCLCVTQVVGDDQPCIVIVVGAPGSPEYPGQFREAADHWQTAASRGAAESIRIGESSETSVTDHDRLQLRSGSAGEGQL